MINNILGYIHIFSNLCLQVRLYKPFLDHHNTKYNIININILRYEELDIFYLSIKDLNIIPKAIILVDSINKEIALMKY